MISVDIEGKAFGATRILAPLKFSVQAGETVALLGPSGVGKTSLLRIIAGLDEAYTGRVERPDALAMVFQEPTLLNWRSALENITLVTNVAPQVAASAMADVGLAGKETLFPAQLSLGQRRRLALARAFSIKPDLLIMDEPFASLDQERVTEMLALSRDLIAANGCTTLFVTHSQAEADMLADRLLRLDGQPATLSET